MTSTRERDLCWMERMQRYRREELDLGDLPAYEHEPSEIYRNLDRPPPTPHPSPRKVKRPHEFDAFVYQPMTTTTTTPAKPPSEYKTTWAQYYSNGKTNVQ